MLRLASYDIVFQEVPGQVSLALNLSNCPNRCGGCHSPHLRDDIGVLLNEELLAELFGKYNDAVTCVCFMGGDAAPHKVASLATFLRTETAGKIKTAWYSGKQSLPDIRLAGHFDFIKLGPYIKQLGGLNAETTNQRFYRVENGNLIDCTHLFRKRKTETVLSVG